MEHVGELPHLGLSQIYQRDRVEIKTLTLDYYSRFCDRSHLLQAAVALLHIENLIRYE